MGKRVGLPLLVGVKQRGVCRELPVGVCARWERAAKAGGWGSGPSSQVAGHQIFVGRDSGGSRRV